MNVYYVVGLPFPCELFHHGILGQKWGVKNGPPYPLGGGDYSESEIKKMYKERKKDNSIYNKKHFDKVIKENEVLSTLSYDANRTKQGDMFYATYKKLDKHQYNALFNKSVKDINDPDAGYVLKYRIDNRANKDIKVASEDSGSEEFKKLYKKDRDFYNFVTDENRMQSMFVNDKYKFRGYRESRKALDKIRSGKEVSGDDVKKVYRMLNYVIPNDGNGNERMARDIANQRQKFFTAMKKSGYGAILDTNDAIYGGFKASAPVIVIDRSAVVLQDCKRTTMTSKRFSECVMVGRKLLGV